MIVLPELYVYAQYSKATNTIVQSDNQTVNGIKNFTMADMERNVGNCALTATTRILDYYYNKYQNNPPAWLVDLIHLWNPNYTYTKMTENDIYKYVVRDIGVEHGFDPNNTGAWNASLENLWYNLVQYTNGDIPKIAKESFEEMGFDVDVKTYLVAADVGGAFIDVIKDEVNNAKPFYLNIAFGDYACHTITGVGYQSYQNQTNGQNINLVQVYDGWSNSYRYVDWNRQGPCSIVTVDVK